jgi:hypothetical protein
VDSHLILKGHNPQVPALQLRYRGPEAVPIMFLGLGTDRVFDDVDAPFPTQIGALGEHLGFKVFGVGVRRASSTLNLKDHL